MENKARAAIEDSERWLSTAKLSENSGSFDIALYSAEMSLEIAMKALLTKKGVDYPKKHDIIDYFKVSIGSKGIPKELKDESQSIIRTFSELLDLRNSAGYNLGALKLDAVTASKARELISLTEKHIALIKKAVNTAK